ncbi:MAG: TolC family outer membrane protein [Pseudomonadota bacterium]|nr:TolC family outer membrane protein [Pseudomonadota bacterium]
MNKLSALSFILTLALTLLPRMSIAITLEQALVSALDHSPEIHQQYARFQAVLQDREEVTANYYPQVKLQAGIGPEHTEYRSGQLVDEDMTRDEIGLRISQLLFNGFSTSANAKRLSYEAEAERYQLLASAENLALQVCETYINTRTAENLVELAQRHVADHESILEDVRRLTRTGHANDTDIAQTSARLANARASLVAAQNNLRDSRAQFVRVVGGEPGQLVSPVPDQQLLPADLEMALSWAKDNHPQLQSALADIDAAKQQVRASKSGYLPRISLEGYANQNHDIGGLEGPEEDYRVMLVLEYDLFNGGRDKARAKASNWRYNESLQVRRNAEEQLAEGTRFAWNAMESLQTQVNLLQSSVDASTLAESGYITQFKLGKRSLLDMLNAKVEVFTARRTYINTAKDYTLSQYRLLNATGRLGYSLRVVYPQQWQEGQP